MIRDYDRCHILKVIFILVGVLLISHYLVLGSGTNYYKFRYNYFINFISFSSLLFISLYYKRFFWYIAFPYIVILSFWAPIGFVHGRISPWYFMSVWATYGSGIGEFFQNIPYDYFVYSVLCIVFVVLFRKFLAKDSINLKIKKPLFIFAIIAFIPTIFAKNAPLYTITDGVIYFSSSYKEMKELQKPLQSSWKIVKVEPKYKNYVVVIGESARRDYHHVYGYPLENTPFLDSVNGLFVDGFNSVGINTISSLSWALAYPDYSNGYKQNIANNIVALSTLAGYETYWLSNQGFMDKGPITKMAKNANHIFFLKSADYYMKNSFDFELLPKFKEFLATKSDKNRVFFLHLIGSHPIFCKRIPKELYMKNKDRKDINIYCYLKTIEQTDSFLKELYGILNKNYKDNNESFSMIYFSDHGLTHRVKKGELSLAINSSIAAKEHFAVPLIRLSSDDVGRKFVKNRSYGNYFAESFAKWTGITTNIKITNDIFEPIEQKDLIDMDKNLIKSKKPDSAKVIENFN